MQSIHTTGNNHQREVSGAPLPLIPAGALRRYPEDSLATTQQQMRTLLRVRGALPFIPPNEPPKSRTDPKVCLTFQSAGPSFFTSLLSEGAQG